MKFADETGITFWPDGENNSSSRPWVVGVHVRRGDVRNKKRIVPHSFFVEAVRSVLYGIAEVRLGSEVGQEGGISFDPLPDSCFDRG